jgi:hypothetical protein
MAKNYAMARKEAQELYGTFTSVGCPAFGGELVYFTSEGFNHLIYKGAGKERDPRVQIMKFELLPKARLIIEMSSTFQEYDEGFEYRVVEKYGKRIKESVLVRCWGLVAIIQKFRVKVVIRQIGNGKKEFYSVIPAWFTRQYRNIKIIETSARGGLLEEDDAEALKNATKKSDAL